MFAILDIETTGGNARAEKITEIAIFVHDGEKITREFSSLVNPEKEIPPFISRLTGITNEMVKDAPKFYEVAKNIVGITEGMTIVAHNALFDYGFIREEFKSLGYSFHRSILCTVKLTRKLMPGYPSYSLGNICAQLGIINDARHRAAGDALATTKLFDMLLSRDHHGIIQSSIKSDPALMKLPPHLDKEAVNNLPEETGVYYLHNERGNIIYIGKSNNIRKRILSHFAEKENAKSLSMKMDVHSITYEVTGSELVALLLESDEIKKHKPRYNRMQRESHFQWGIFKNVNQDGYFTLKAARLKNQDEEPLLTARNSDEAKEILDAQVEKFNLCQKLCGLYDIKYACFRYHVNQCNGACICKEHPADYNNRVKQLIRKWRYENQDFFIIGDGRGKHEQSVVAVENGRYIGFGFMDRELTSTSPEQLKFFIKNYADNRDVQRIIQRYLHKAGSQNVITF
ncbi:MAG: exonuclease domain-containing protein [Bacteroidota bacterium]